jgi:hypothetical protein
VSKGSASYTRVHVDRVCPETLRHFNVPWEWESVGNYALTSAADSLTFHCSMIQTTSSSSVPAASLSWRTFTAIPNRSG